MRAVITVVGKDTVGIFAKVSTFCAERNVNIVGVSQTILEDMFCMMMQNENGLAIHAMHEDIFNTMHRI